MPVVMEMGFSGPVDSVTSATMERKIEKYVAWLGDVSVKSREGTVETAGGGTMPGATVEITLHDRNELYQEEIKDATALIRSEVYRRGSRLRTSHATTKIRCG